MKFMQFSTCLQFCWRACLHSSSDAQLGRLGAVLCVVDATHGPMDAASTGVGATEGKGAAAGLLESAADVENTGVQLVGGVDGSLDAEEPVLSRRCSNKDTLEIDHTLISISNKGY